MRYASFRAADVAELGESGLHLCEKFISGMFRVAYAHLHPLAAIR